MAETEHTLHISIRNEALFNVMYYCGLRVSEVLQLKIEHYDPINKQIFCKRLKGSNSNTLKILDDSILSALKRHIHFNHPSTYLFENSRGEMLSRKTIDRIIKKTCKEAKIMDSSKHHCHTLRHTRAIILAEHGFDLKEIQYWLGHKELSNTLIYYQFTSRQHDSMYKKLKC